MRVDKPNSQLHLAVIDSQPMICQAFELMLKDIPETSLEFTALNLEEGLRLTQVYAPELLLIGKPLTHHHPFDSVSLVREYCPDAKIVYLDEQPSAPRCIMARTHGLSGYVTKNHRFEQILSLLLRLRDNPNSFVADKDADCLKPKPGVNDPQSQGILSKLTAREREILVYVAQGMTAIDIADQLSVAQSTVENHKWKMMKKLRAHKNIDLVHVAVRAGLLDG